MDTVPHILLIIASVVLGGLVLGLASVYAYGRFARKARGAPSYALPVAADATRLDRRLAALAEAEDGLGLITSPYFVPGNTGAGQLTQLAARGGDVRILTNSLAATDVAAVHGGYAPRRKELLTGGVKLYELKPDGGMHRLSLFGSGRASLHTKAFLIDGKTGFVGSFNFDPRSASLNTEMGILFECAEISAMMDKLFDEEITGEMSYHVNLNEKGRLRWSYIEGGEWRNTTHEPESRVWRRAFARVVSWLPIHSQL